MKPSLQFRLSQHLTLTPQLQQSIRLLQLSTVELNQEIERILMENPALEREDGEEHAGGGEQDTAPRTPRLVSVSCARRWSRSVGVSGVACVRSPSSSSSGPRQLAAASLGQSGSAEAGASEAGALEASSVTCSSPARRSAASRAASGACPATINRFPLER